MSEDPTDIEKIISGLNAHTPGSRRSLLDYMENGNLTYRTRGGIVCDIEQSEIDFLAANCTEVEKLRLRLPIFVTTDTSGSDSAWKVDGMTESKVIARILGRTQFREDSVRFYHPDYLKLRKLLPTTAIILYLP